MIQSYTVSCKRRAISGVSLIRCTIKIFMGGGGGEGWRMADGEGSNSERCSKWGGGVIKESFQKHLK